MAELGARSCRYELPPKLRFALGQKPDPEAIGDLRRRFDTDQLSVLTTAT